MQIVGQFVEPAPIILVVIAMQSAVTIGQALEATVHAAGDKPQSDAAAFQAVEVRVKGSNAVIPGGLAACAQ